jgi:ribonuclease HIII
MVQSEGNEAESNVVKKGGLVKNRSTSRYAAAVIIDQTERKRLARLLKFEKKARLEGFQQIAGIDEAGRGPLAGPVVACACILPKGSKFPLINDSNYSNL